MEAIAEALAARGVLTGCEVAEVLADVEADRARAAEPARRRNWRAIVKRAGTSVDASPSHTGD